MAMTMEPLIDAYFETLTEHCAIAKYSAIFLYCIESIITLCIRRTKKSSRDDLYYGFQNNLSLTRFLILRLSIGLFIVIEPMATERGASCSPDYILIFVLLGLIVHGVRTMLAGKRAKASSDAHNA
ncbi:hypothetical protein dsat_0027 [Alkalidesulfovibrio alkalitolerans DSM 16529]|uniref:Uncharacterized protein n=2 Tax=Alkalidesulfovibrio alkalitolerans TaxID=293256 RepID=S7UKL4_9BACT|nr:hypothetical protein dsat_0027 [Alkalidesulfovibrio alkalitolerans DSM 16529]